MRQKTNIFEQVKYVDSFEMSEFLKFDSIIDILPVIKSMSLSTKDGRDLKIWQEFFTSKGTPWLLLKVKEKDKVKKKPYFKLWKRCEVEEGEPVHISSLFPQFSFLKPDSKVLID